MTIHNICASPGFWKKSGFLVKFLGDRPIEFVEFYAPYLVEIVKFVKLSP
ncbi:MULTISPECIES: hypothetical protein [unclassified Microcoleus]